MRPQTGWPCSWPAPGAFTPGSAAAPRERPHAPGTAPGRHAIARRDRRSAAAPSSAWGGPRRAGPAAGCPAGACPRGWTTAWATRPAGPGRAVPDGPRRSGARCRRGSRCAGATPRGHGRGGGASGAPGERQQTAARGRAPERPRPGIGRGAATAARGGARRPAWGGPPVAPARRLGDGPPLPAGRHPRLGQAWEPVTAVPPRLAPCEAARRVGLQTAAAAVTPKGPHRLRRTGLGSTRAWRGVRAGGGGRAWRQRQAGGALSGLTPPLRRGAPPLTRRAAPQPATRPAARWPWRGPGAGGACSPRARCRRGSRSAGATAGGVGAAAGWALGRVSGAWPGGGGSSQGAGRTGRPAQRRAGSHPEPGVRRAGAGVGRASGDRGRSAARAGAGAVHHGARQGPEAPAGAGERSTEADPESRAWEAERPHACERPEPRSQRRSLPYVRGQRPTSDQEDNKKGVTRTAT
jgi:hypothetical protein